jgi:uncharacterized radical SAM superfamily Fe-S cluster-containing enzyme
LNRAQFSGGGQGCHDAVMCSVDNATNEACIDNAPHGRKDAGCRAEIDYAARCLTFYFSFFFSEDLMTPQVDFRQPWLDLLWLEVTGRCNLRCTHCYADSSPDVKLDQGLGPADWIRIIDEAADLGCQRVQFIGGEPMLHPILPSLVAAARARAFEHIEIYTNGTFFRAHEARSCGRRR